MILSDEKRIMQKGIITEIDWGYIGASLANLSDIEQVKFFKAFAGEFKQFGSTYQQDKQSLAINEKLTEEEKYIFATIGWDEK